jgi:hypothetical protein
LAKRGRKPYPVYQFDIEGNFIYRHADIHTASENLFIPESAIRAAIKEKGCCYHKFYFSKSKDFIIPKKKQHQNPLLTKNKMHIPDFLVDEADFDEED